MNNRTRSMAVIAVVSLLVALAVPALAGTSREIFVPEGTSLSGTELEKGFYTLTYRKNGSKDSFIISISRGGRKIATAMGVREHRDERQSGGIRFRIGDDGMNEIAEIKLSGKRSVIVIDRQS